MHIYIYIYLFIYLLTNLIQLKIIWNQTKSGKCTTIKINPNLSKTRMARETGNCPITGRFAGAGISAINMQHFFEAMIILYIIYIYIYIYVYIYIYITCRIQMMFLSSIYIYVYIYNMTIYMCIYIICM